MGLGLLGRGLGDAIFLAEHGAKLLVTDLRDEEALAPSLEKLQKYKNIEYVLGEHRLKDFRACDFVIKAAGIPLHSPFIAEARKSGVPVEMDASLFAKLAPEGVTLVGVTGTRGKSTTTALIYEILKRGIENREWGMEGVKGKRVRIKDSTQVFRGGNLVPEATLPLLDGVKAGDVVVLELDSWQLQGFHDAKLSPQVAVFTTFLDDHLVYYKGDPKAPAALGRARKRYLEDKVAIFKYQKAGDVLIAGEQIARKFRKGLSFVTKDSPLRSVVMAKKSDVPEDWKIPLLGEHNLENIACAVAVARHFDVPEAAIQKAVENFKPVPGRLEYLRTVRGVKIYNDNNATTPDATIAALRALNPKSETPNPKQIQNSKSLNAKRSTLNASRIILIMGGTDKVLGRHDALVDEISKRCKAAILLKETGTDMIKQKLEALRSNTLQIKEADGLKACVDEALRIAQRGDIILFSPAFASFGKWFKNEYDRGAQFVKLVRKL